MTIRHSVAFRLRHARGSVQERAFLDAADILAAFPGVIGFVKLREVSPKNEFDFVFAMEFADEAAYSSYNEHPDHVAFVRDRWESEVADFAEIDTVAWQA